MALNEPDIDKKLSNILEAVAPNGCPFTESEFDKAYKDLSFTVSYGGARPPKDVELVVGGSARRISYENRSEYVRLAKVSVCDVCGCVCVLCVDFARRVQKHPEGEPRDTQKRPVDTQKRPVGTPRDLLTLSFPPRLPTYTSTTRPSAQCAR